MLYDDMKYKIYLVDMKKFSNIFSKQTIHSKSKWNWLVIFVQCGLLFGVMLIHFEKPIFNYVRLS